MGAIFDLSPDGPIKFVSRIWYAMGEERDLLAMTFQIADGSWHGRYRFRYYKTKGPWDGQDTKNVYEVGPAAREKLDHIMGQILNLMCSIGFGELTELVINADNATAMEILVKQPFAHSMNVKRE